jgi:Fe2+ transport protein
MRIDANRLKRPPGLVIALLMSAALLTGCAAADKNHASSGGNSSSSSASSGAMAGMNMGSSSSSSTAAAPAVDGIKPVPTQVLASASWQGMKIRAMAMTAVPFVIYNGTSEQMVKPGPNTSFHLMVMLSDSQTNVPIPYAGVWATISKAGKVVYDERQWPMISRYMGPHYGNDVSLPGGGAYQLSLLISPPVSARHVEYQNVWLKPHRVTLEFHWQPTT